MLIENLKNTTKQMKRLSKIETSALDTQRKFKNDKDYNDLVRSVTLELKKYQYARKNLNYSISDDTLNNFLDLVVELSQTTSDGEVDENSLSKAKKNINKVNSCLVRDWTSFYNRKAKGYIGSLETLEGLTDDQIEINEIRNTINLAQFWQGLSNTTEGKTVLERFKNCTDKILRLLEKQNLNDAVKAFLNAVSRGKANITDLTPEVLEWIRDQHMESRFAIEFANKKA